MSTVYLRVKIKSLAAEAVIIRREERKLRTRREPTQPGSLWWGLNHHRRHDVRREARAAALAYGFLRGRAYKQIEGKTHCDPDRDRVAALVKKYGPPGVHGRVPDWFKGGDGYVAPREDRRAA